MAQMYFLRISKKRSLDFTHRNIIHCKREKNNLVSTANAYDTHQEFIKSIALTNNT